MANKKKILNKNIIIIIIVAIVILFLLTIKIASRKQKESNYVDIQKLNVEYKEKQNKKAIVDLSGKTEIQRMQYYCGEFFKLIDNNKYEDAYELLYSDYKENYFPTLESFKRYFQDYFPSDFSLSYDNIERLGDIYVLNASISDVVNGSKYGHNFSLYVVLKENALNDYNISFSRNSAVGEEE